MHFKMNKTSAFLVADVLAQQIYQSFIGLGEGWSCP